MAVPAAAAYPATIPTVKKVQCTHQAITILTAMVAPAAMEQVCKALSALHVITATVRSGAKADLAAVAIR